MVLHRRVEEVNAWAKYEETGRSARQLSQHHGARRRSVSAPMQPPDLVMNQLRNSLSSDSHIQQGTRPPSSPDKNSNQVLPSSSKRHKWNATFANLSWQETRNDHILKEEEEDEEEEEFIFVSPLLKQDLVRIFGVYFGRDENSSRDGDDDTMVDSVLLDQENDDQTNSNIHKSLWYRLLQFTSLVRGTMSWLPPLLRHQALVHRYKLIVQVLHFIEYSLRGVGQVFFQNNPLTGALIVAALLVQSPRVTVYGLLALAIGNGTALCFLDARSLIHSGLLGYNAVLVGLALGAMDARHSFQGDVVLCSIVLGAFSSILFVAMSKLLVPYKAPPFTFPFNMAALIFFLAAPFEMGRVEYAAVRMPQLPNEDNSVTGTLTGREFFEGTIRGMGQVFLMNELASGVLVWAGIAVCSWISALAAFVGSAVGTATALLIGSSQSAMVAGLFGYNSSLSCTAMLMFYAPGKEAVVLGILASVLTTLVQVALRALFQPVGLPVLTLPFCFVSLTFIIIQGTTSKVIAIPLSSMTTPEDHYRRVQVLKYGFSLFLEVIHPIQWKEPNKDGPIPPPPPDQSPLTSLASSRRLNQSLNNLSEMIRSRHDVEDKKSVKEKKKNRLTSDQEWALERANVLFQAMDVEKKGYLQVADFKSTLKSCGLRDAEGLQFAILVFGLMDLDESNTVERSEFGTFCLVSRSLFDIRQNVTKFVEFVDADANGDIDLEEIDDALDYLGEDRLTSADRDKLAQAVGHNGSIDSLEFINFVTVVAVKHLVQSYHDYDNREVGSNLIAGEKPEPDVEEGENSSA